MQTAIVTNIQSYSIHDGPGIRTIVFFKGCGLLCKWCANPENISTKPQVGFIKSLCQGCGRCAKVCPKGAIRPGSEVHRVDYAKCDACGACVDVCFYDALVMYGKPMTVEECFDEVRRDKMFYDESGGGVTVSGGDPLLYAEFVRDLFELCHKEGINTAIETEGFVNESAIRTVMPVTDYFLYDLKQMDPEVHRQYTGHSNEQIIKNAELLARNGADLLFRLPLIPGVNDRKENIQATAAFVKRICGDGGRVELMPYHRMGQSKYTALDLPYPVPEILVMTEEQINAVKDAYLALGVKCTVSR